jgi:hypothetical protein
LRTLLGLVLLCSCTRPHAVEPASVEGLTWHVTIDRDLVATQRLCWSAMAPERIATDAEAAMPFWKRTEKTASCETFTGSLPAVAKALDSAAMLTRYDDALFGSFDAWLMKPSPWPKGLVGKLTIVAPSDVRVVLPNPRATDGSYAVPYSTWSFMARMAIGRFDAFSFDAAGSHMTVVRLPGVTPQLTREGSERFVADAARAVSSLDGRMPTNDARVFLLPGRRDDDPITFGMAMRGAGASVVLHVAENATDESVRGHWVPVHELAHLWLPPVTPEDAWLSEGFASYYQCVLRSRSGAYSERDAWNELLAGFARGKRQAGTRPLKNAKRHAFQQIYWGGAAIVFKLDVLLRSRGSSLDAAVAKLRRAEPDDGSARLEDRPALDVVAALGADLVDVVKPLLEVPFPDVEPELRALGITKEGPTSAPGAHIREAISGRR